MFGSFFKVAFRKFFRYGVHTLTNLLGLAIGIAFSIIIFLYVNMETGYDRFHGKADRIYRVVVQGSVTDNELSHAVTPAPLARTLVHNIDEVENAVRVAKFGAWLVRYGDVHYNEDNIIFADSSFFSIFSFPLVQGDPHDVLRMPESIVISQTVAEKYFGTENPIGKLLQIENDTTYYRVTGVMEDVPAASHMHFDMVASLSSFPLQPYDSIWIANFLYTYFLAKENASQDSLAEKVDQLAQEYAIPAYASLLELAENKPDYERIAFAYKIQRLRDIHLRSSLEGEFEANGNMLNIYLFTALAIVILVISCLNFVNLSTARTADRAREVALRKIAGSERAVLIRQFLTESSVLAMTAMVLALLVTELSLPPLNRYMGLSLDLSQLVNSSGILMLILLIAGIGVLSGLYPAFYLSSFDPVRVMRPFYHVRPNHGFFRKAFAFLQFFITIGLITMTFIIFRQYDYMTGKDLGFDKENLLVIRRPDGLAGHLDRYMETASHHPGVASLTISSSIPGSAAFSRIPFYAEGQPASQNVRMDIQYVTPSFATTFGIPVISGRFFSDNVPGDTAVCVLNRTAADLLGLSDPVGKKLVNLGESVVGPAYDIIGIVGDVNYESLENPVQPLVMILMPGNMEGYLTVRLNAQDQQSTIDFLDEEWDKITEAYPFVSYFLDENLKEIYQPVRETGRIFLVIAIAAVLFSSLGLYSLLAYRFCQQKRETGVRKVLGESVTHILFRRFRDVFVMVFLASILAWAGVYFLASSWLDEYYYHIGIQPVFFLISPLILLVILSATSGYQAWVSAATNPGLELKYE